MMLSTATTAAPVPTMTQQTTTQNVPYTIQQKMDRIDRLPRILRSFERNRSLPKETISQIQEGMEGVISTLHPASKSALDTYNLALRDIVSRPSLRAQDARILNKAFVNVLASAGADPAAVELMSTNLDSLVTTVNTSNAQPVFLSTNDYSTVLQIALIVGQPMPAPQVPTITKDSGSQAAPGHNVSNVSQPTFQGTYQTNAVLQIYNQDTGQVLGTGTAQNLGHYTVKFSTPMEVGTYNLRIRALDELGHSGTPSSVFTLKVVAPKTPPTATPALRIGLATPEGPIRAARA